MNLLIKFHIRKFEINRLMSEILEIRDGCQTPLELITSQTFKKYLDIYKQKFLFTEEQIQVDNRSNLPLDTLHVHIWFLQTLRMAHQM